MTLTREELVDGYDFSTRKGREAALSNNAKLRSIVAMDAAGRLMLDTAAMKQSLLRGKAMATDRWLANFYENASEADFTEMSNALGVDMKTASADEIRGAAEAYRARPENVAVQKQIAEAKKIASESAKALPKRVAMVNDGVRRYKLGDADIAVMKSGDTYRIYEYDTGDVSRALSVDELNRAVRDGVKQAEAGAKSDKQFALVGRAEDGRGIYRSNYPENTPKDVKQRDIVNLVQNVWSKNPIKLNLIVDGKTVPIEARFNPELTERSDLSKIAFGNRKGTASEKRITMNLSSDLYQIAEESHHVGSKTETGKSNAAHVGVTTWHYFLTDLVYVEADGTEIECYMNIDVKQNDRGNWFYSFAIEKGSRPADVLSVVTDESATTSTNSIPQNGEKVNTETKNSEKNSSNSEKKTERKLEAERIDKLLREQVKDYREISDGSQTLVRQVYRQALAHGLSEAEALTFARISAHSGVGVMFSKALCRTKDEDGNVVYGDSWYSASRNKIIINPEGTRSANLALIHELDHAIRKAYKGKTTVYMRQVFKHLTEDERNAIIKEYKGVKTDSRIDLYNDEFNAYFAEKCLKNKKLQDILFERKGLLEKVVDFFTGASKAYSDDPKLARAAKWYEKRYRKMFEDLSARNKGRNAVDTVVGAKSDEQFAFGGVNAASANKMSLENAERMLKDGAASETVRKETGWFKGYDGKWRFEIDDFDSSLIEDPKLQKHTDDGEIYFTGKMSDIFDHKALFSAYPELKDINVVIQKTELGTDAIYQPNSNYITLSQELFKRHTKAYYDYLNGGRKAEIERIEASEGYKKYNNLYNDDVMENMEPTEWLEAEKKAREEFYSSDLGKRYYELMWGKSGFVGETFELGWSKEAKAVLLHELQHAVQNIEGFAKGTNTRDKNYDLNAGEIESRDVGKRADFTAEKRKNTRPDIDRTDVVIKQDSDVVCAIVELDNGMQYVEATESQVIKGTDSSKWAQQVARYINDVIRGNKDFVIKTTEGDFLTITRDTAYKAGHRNSVRNPDGTYRQMTDAEYKVKLNAEIHINELAEVSHKPNKPPVPDKKKHKFASKGFTYRTAYFKDFDGRYYKLTISVGENGTVSTVYNVGQIKNDTLPSGKIVSTFKGSKANSASSTNIIPNPGEKVNTSDKKSLEIPSDASLALPTGQGAASTMGNVGKTSFKAAEAKVGEKIKASFGTARDRLYIETVDETYGVEKYLRKVGGREDAIPFVQQVRAAETMAQTMIGTDQYDVTEAAGKGKRLGDGLATIFKPIRARGKAIEGYDAMFDDYLLHQLNVDRMTLEERSLDEQKKRVERLSELDKRLTEIKKKLIANKKELASMKGKLDVKSKTRRAEIREENKKLVAEHNSLNLERRAVENAINAFVPLENKPVFGENAERKTAITAEESRKIIEEYEKKHPQFKEIAEKVWKYSDNLLEMRVKGGLISAEGAAEMRKLYPHYVPSFRDVDGGGRAAPVKGAGNMQVSSTVKRAKGGGEDIISIEESLAKQTTQAVKAIQINRLARAVADSARTAGDTTYVMLDEANKKRVRESKESKTEYEENARVITKMQPVSKLSGKEFSSEEPGTLKEKVIAFFNSFGNEVEAKDLGKVSVTTSSFRDDKAHGLTRNKVISFKAIPEVLKNGKIIDVYKPDGKPYERITVAAPITIGNEKFYMGVMVQRDTQSNRVYLHDIITEKATLSFNTEPATENGEGIRDKGHLFITSILQNALKVNPEIQNDENFQMASDEISGERDVELVTKSNSITFYENGKQVTMAVSKELFAGFKGLTSSSVPDFLLARAANKVMQTFKNLVTQWSPAFSVRNFVRDVQDAFINSKHPKKFFAGMKGALLDIINNSEDWKIYRAYGAAAELWIIASPPLRTC